MASNCHNDTGTPAASLCDTYGGTILPDGVTERLALFSEWTGTTPPDRLLNGEGEDRTFTDEFLVYCRINGLSLDWVWLGNEMSLVMRAHHAAKEGRA